MHKGRGFLNVNEIPNTLHIALSRQHPQITNQDIVRISHGIRSTNGQFKHLPIFQMHARFIIGITL
jgi:hypothetical protein